MDGQRGVPRKNPGAPWNSEKKDFDLANLTSLHLEHVLVLRLMKVNDNGGKSPNLVAQDSRKLKIVHLQDDKTLYTHQLQAGWIINYITYMDQFFIDNKPYTLPEIQ